MCVYDTEHKKERAYDENEEEVTAVGSSSDYFCTRKARSILELAVSPSAIIFPYDSLERASHELATSPPSKTRV